MTDLYGCYKFIMEVLLFVFPLVRDELRDTEQRKDKIEIIQKDSQIYQLQQQLVKLQKLIPDSLKPKQ